MIERRYFEEEEDILAFDFLTIKPLGKSSSGNLITTAIIVALPSGEVRAYDIYNNILFTLFVPGG